MFLQLKECKRWDDMTLEIIDGSVFVVFVIIIVMVEEFG